MIPVSIIIVTYNSEKEIVDCINSLLPQLNDFGDEIIVIDNNSSDDTISLLHNITNDHISIIQNRENVGYTKANNQGINQAQGTYLLLLNPDTIIPKGTIKKLIDKLEVDKSLGVIAPQLRFPIGNIQKSCRRFPRRRDVLYESFGLGRLFPKSKEFNGWKMGDFDHKSERLVDQPAGAALLIPKNVIDKIGLLDEQFQMFYSDVDLCKRIWDAGYKIKFSPDIHFFHIGGASIKRNRIKILAGAHKSFWKYFNKHYSSILDKLYNLLIGLLLIIGIPVRIIFYTVFPSQKNRNRDVL